MQCARHVNGITFIRYAHDRTIRKPNILKVFVSKKTEEPKQESQNRIRSPIPERGKA
jgi:hypothetical protein